MIFIIMRKILLFLIPLLLIGCGEQNSNNKLLKCIDENQDRFQNDPDNRKVERWCEGR